MSQSAYKRMYGCPADIDKVWEDRDGLHELTWYMPSFDHAKKRRKLKQQRRRRQRSVYIIGLLAVVYLMLRMVT